MAKHLTVQDKIIIHLASYLRYAEEFECPEEMSQAGIANAIGKSRAHTTLELKALRDEELVSERVSHVKGAKSKRKVYNLTASGMQLVQNLRAMVDGLAVELELDGDVSEMGGRAAVDDLVTRSGVSELEAMGLVLSAEGVIRPSSTRRSTTQQASAHQENLQELRYFFGRERELEEINTFIEGKETTLSITGMPGIGKTTLARQLVATLGDAKIFYIQLYGFDSPVSVAMQLARHMNDNGMKQLGDYLANKTAPDIREMGWLMHDVLSKERLIVVIDDCDVVAGSLDGFLRMIHDIAAKEENSKLITLSGKAPGFYDRKDVDVDASVREMELDGLDVEASELLLAEVGKIVDEGKWAELAKSVGGHPLALELADDETGTGRFQDYIYEQIISKDMDSFDFLSLCSVLRGGFNPWNMKLFGFGKAQGLSANAYFVKYDDGGVRLHQAVGQAILERAGERGMKMAHERAADYCREFDEEPTEVLYHLIEAGLVERGCEHAASIRNYLVSNSNLAMTLDMLRKLDGLAGGENLEVVDILAEVMNLGGDWTGALELSRKVADADDAGLRLGALVRTARIENRRGKPGKAMEDIQLAEELASAHDGEVPLASILLTKGVILRGTGDYKGAMQALGRSIDVALEEGGKKETMQALMERGNIDILIGSFKSAEKDLKKALAAAEELNSQIDVARIMVNLSLLEMKRGELEGAYRGFNNALLIGREICQPRIIGYGLVGLAECSNMMSRPDDSLKFSNEAMPIFESLGAVDQLSAVHSNIGMSHALGGNGERAMENFEASIALVENLESPYTLGLRYMEYGKGQQVLGDVDGASKMLKKAQTIFVDIGAEEDVRLVTKMFQSLS